MTGIKKHNLISVLMALVAFTGMAGLTTPAFALTCERKTNNASGFVSYSAWESWFPKTLSIPDSQFKPKGGGSTSMVATRDTQDSKGYSKRMTYQLLANGDLIAKQSQTQGNFKSTSPIRYKCSTTAVALRTGKTNSDSAICYHATINGQWAESKSLRKYVDEAKRRGLDCGVSSKKSDSKTKIASSSEDFSDLTDTKVCFFVRGLGRGLSENSQKAIENEAKRRGLNCGVKDSSNVSRQVASTSSNNSPNLSSYSDKEICSFSTNNREWRAPTGTFAKWVSEAKRRGLNCGVGDSSSKPTQITSTASAKSQVKSSTNSSDLQACPSSKDVSLWSNCVGTYTYPNGGKYVGEFKDGNRNGQSTYTLLDGRKYIGEFKDDKFNGQATYTYPNGTNYVGEWKDDQKNGQGTYTWSDGTKYVGQFKDDLRNGQGTYTLPSGTKYVGEFKDGLFNGEGIMTYADGRAPQEGVWKDDKFQYAKKLTPGSSTVVASNSNDKTEELTAAQKEAERLRQELAALKAERADTQSKIDSDNQIPLIDIVEADASGKRGVIKGRVSDKSGIAELVIGGQVVALNSSGGFNWQGFVPAGGVSIKIEATDKAGNTAVQQVRLERGQMQKPKGPRFERLNPLRGKKAVKNKDALALVIGVSDYERTSDPALYADKDAEYFHDYAAEKLGIPESQIFTLLNNKADRVEILKAARSWLLRMSKKDRSDIYVFFAGHGLASSDGTNMFLLPYDGDPELLEDSAIDRKQLFADIEAISPRSVTVFLDSCYSGSTRSGGTLVASLRPVFVRSQEQSIPSGFTVLSAAKSDQTSQSLEEAQHGLFSYFLMRGLEGEADTNKDNQITAGELHSFVTDKVERQSSFQQTPELQGDESRVLVRFE